MNRPPDWGRSIFWKSRSRTTISSFSSSALLQPRAEEDEKFQGTLSDLHIADIIQLKCMSGATSVLEFTGPHGEKARVFFDNGQVRHATAPGKTGVDALTRS